MLHLIQSNKLEVLAGQLLQLMHATRDQGSLFEEDIILVQSPGMAQWLKLQIAQQSGIAANVSFPLPSSYIWERYRQHIPDLPQQSAFTKENMSWKLMRILPELLEQPEFAGIRAYLSEQTSLKTYQLCHKIADVYDQYLVYRPDWILQWEVGHDQLEDTDVSLQAWQPILWRALVDYSVSLGESPWHRANLHHRLLDALGQLNVDKSRLKPLYVFGLSAMPIQQLEVLSALTRSRDVVIFWFNPSAQYWGDIVDTKTLAKLELKFLQGKIVSGTFKTDDIQTGNPLQVALDEYLSVGNPLLASWGKLGRDYQDLLVSLEVGQFDAFVEQTPVNLLSHIQHEIEQLTFRGSAQPLGPEELLSNGLDYPKIAVSRNDQSLQIHSCHSKLRELEVLHDQLLHLFERESELSPGDIIVMMPDVASYAPIIDGIFGGADVALRIPYAISDRNVAEESPLLNSFNQLMSLHKSRLALSDVLTLCEVPAIRRKFALSETEFEQLSHWLTEAGIRWGWDAQDKARWQLPQEGQNTWLFGLRRMLAGYAVGQDEVFSSYLGEIAPYIEIEGQQAVALGKFYLFSQLLHDALAFCQQSASLSEKVSGALTLLERLYEPDEQEQPYVLQLRQALEQLSLHQQQYPLAIEQDIFATELQQKLHEKGVGQRFLAGYVNFCTLMPMRSIPFKVVCILGLNDGDYPRQVNPLGFDLMRVARQRKGDRSRRLDDRYLFLEAILSARDYLYLSFQGHSAKDNSVRSASLLLSELLDYCRHCFIIEGDEALPPADTEQRLFTHLLTEHPLQPFAEGYFLSTSAAQSTAKKFLPASFQQQWLSVVQQQRHEVQNKGFSPPQPLTVHSDNLATELNIEQLIRFVHNPVKGFFQTRWHSYFPALSDAEQDQEPFILDGLARYQLNTRWILDEVDEQQISQQWLVQLKAEGKLPQGNSGALSLSRVTRDYALLKARITEHTAGLRPHSVNLTGSLPAEEAMVNLQGRISGCFGRQLIMWRPGKLRAKDRLSLWLNWLALCALAHEHQWQSACFIGNDKVCQFVGLSQAQAQTLLQQWLTLWWRGQHSPMPFFAETSWTWVSTLDVNKTRQSWEGNYFVSGEGQEAHIARVYPEFDRVFSALCEQAEWLLQPMLHNEQQAIALAKEQV